MRRLVQSLLAFLGRLALRLLRASVRAETGGATAVLEGAPPIFAFWHGRQLGLLCWRYPAGLAVLVSHSRDGALQARVLRGLGFAVVRGSTHHGPISGLRGLLRRVEAEGRGAALAVDGGRGPLHRVHPGALLLAARSGRPIVPVGVAIRRRVILDRTWCRYQIPLPFTEIAVHLGQPISVPASLDHAERARLCAEVDRALHHASAAAEAQVGAAPDPCACTAVDG